MPAALLFMLQVVGPPALAPERPRDPRPCPAAAEGDEVVVCGRPNQERFRVRLLPEPDGGRLPRAEVGFLGDVKGAAEVEQGNVGGVPSNRIMLRLKLPF